MAKKRKLTLDVLAAELAAGEIPQGSLLQFCLREFRQYAKEAKQFYRGFKYSEAAEQRQLCNLYYYQILGFLGGLRACGRITETELHSLTHEAFDICSDTMNDSSKGGEPEI